MAYSVPFELKRKCRCNPDSYNKAILNKKALFMNACRLIEFFDDVVDLKAWIQDKEATALNQIFLSYLATVNASLLESSEREKDKDENSERVNNYYSLLQKRFPEADFLNRGF